MTALGIGSYLAAWLRNHELARKELRLDEEFSKLRFGENPTNVKI